MKNFRIIYLLMFILYCNVAPAQDTPEKEGSKTFSEKTINPSIKNVSIKNILGDTDHDLKSNINFKNEIIIAENNFKFSQNKKTEKYSFDIISSVGRNINFSGIWDSKVVMNFSPSMYIQPIEFINIYANYRLSSFIPTDLSEGKMQLKSFVIQSLTLLAVDNSVKLLLANDTWISGFIEYAIKNLVMFCFIKPDIKSNNDHTIPRAEDEYYYYSVNIRF